MSRVRRYAAGLCRDCGGSEDVKTRRDSSICNNCWKDYKQKYYDSKRELVFSHYGYYCSCCGEATKEFLSIDHVNNDGNLHIWPSGTRITGVHLYQKIVAAGFPDIYQVYCMNCNFGKRMNNGVCPHKML